MPEKPILFSAPMVRAILDGSKTMTRRILKDKPRYAVGDLLWVRETFGYGHENNVEPGVYYRVTDPGWDAEKTGFRWRPSIHMPRAASRITLEVVAHRVERLQEITESDARAEGVECPDHDFPGGFCLGHCPHLAKAWITLWDSLNAKRGHGWDTNPLVEVVTFRVVK